jgi:hypothetical protein
MFLCNTLNSSRHQNRGPSFSKINLTSKTYNGEWESVGESVQPPGQFALGEFRHPALKEYHPCLAYAVRAAGMAWKKDPSQWPCYRITFGNNQQRWVLCDRCRLKRRDDKQRDDSEALGLVIHLPTATAAIHENPNPGVQMPAGDSQTP